MSCVIQQHSLRDMIIMDTIFDLAIIIENQSKVNQWYCVLMSIFMI